MISQKTLHDNSQQLKKNPTRSKVAALMHGKLALLFSAGFKQLTWAEHLPTEPTLRERSKKWTADVLTWAYSSYNKQSCIWKAKKPTVVWRETKEDNDGWCWRMERSRGERHWHKMEGWIIHCLLACLINWLCHCNYPLFTSFINSVFDPIWCSSAVKGAPTLLPSHGLRDFICRIRGAKRNTLINSMHLVSRAMRAVPRWPGRSKAKDMRMC